MIDENKLIEELEKQCPDWKSSEIGYLVKGTINDCIEIIKRQPKVGEWIPVSEELPTNTKNVLVTTIYGVVLMAFCGISKRWLRLNGKVLETQDYPIAWMPLPKAYEVEENER